MADDWSISVCITRQHLMRRLHILRAPFVILERGTSLHWMICFTFWNSIAYVRSKIPKTHTQHQYLQIAISQHEHSDSKHSESSRHSEHSIAKFLRTMAYLPCCSNIWRTVSFQRDWLLRLMKVKVDEKNASRCISCYCLYSATPLMVIDSYSPLLS